MRTSRLERFLVPAAVAVGVTVGGAGASADIFCVNGARPALVRRHVTLTTEGDAAASVLRRLPPSRGSCTTCHLAPGPASLLLPDALPLWPLNAYGQALTILSPGLPPGGVGDDAATLDAFTRVDRLPTDPRDPAAPTYGDRIRAGLPPQPLFPADDDEPRGDGRGARAGPVPLSLKDALTLVVLRDGPILQLSEVGEIDAATAGVLARFDGDLLMLGLRSLPIDVAENLAGSRADTVWLHSLTDVEPAAAAAIARCPGDLLVTGLERLESAALAAKIAARPGPLGLPFLRSISPDAARVLVDRDDRVCLAGLEDLPVETQEVFAAGRCRLDLPALRRLDSPALTRKLAASPMVYLGGLEELSVDVVAMLLEQVAGRRGVVLPLRAVSAAAAAALLKAEPNTLGRAIFIGRDLSADRLRTLAGPSPGGAVRGAGVQLRAPRTCFPEITELSPELAAVAAESDASFPNLRRLDSAALAAAVVRQTDGWLTIQSVRSLSADAAGEVANDKPLEGLRLPSLRQLPPDVAESLLRNPRSFMDLGGCEEISTEALRLVLARIQNKGSSASLRLGVSRLPAGPFAPPAEARRETKRFDLTLPSLTAVSADDARNLVAGMRPAGDFLSITVPSLASEAANVLADWGGVLQLSGLETLTPDVAKALARLPARRGYAGSISLDTVKTLELASLAELATARRPFSLGGLTEITPELAEAVVRCPTCSLRFPAVRSITPEAVALLVTGKTVLAVTGLTAVDPEVARLLAACPAWDPRLPAVKLLSPEAARALGAFVSTFGDLQLPGLTSLEPEVAEAVATCRRWVPSFPAVTTIEPAAVAALAGCKRPVALPGLKTLTPEVAAALAACPPWNGGLGITGFDAPDSVAVARALARREGGLSLPRLKRISPKTLTALLAKTDVEIPPLETLTLIAEPDGSPVEDFVIPEAFQRRQQRRP